LPLRQVLDHGDHPHLLLDRRFQRNREHFS
jgi:hypothetical protein